ncbi:hypothetical protein VTK73DRAFT_2749 [Phialemonium thermophilum]|uniref:Amine oxidase domain-containing protein n=1 Tax=Phialemonium thermophilum TaxID=223376 RepID=A0ABR3Y269_9PEZI
MKVTVLEKNNFTGGRCSLIHTEGGYRFDQGPSLLLLPNLFRDTFRDLDCSLDKAGVQLLRCPTNYDVWFPDGERFRTSADEALMKGEIERFEGQDGFRRYLKWKAEAHEHYTRSMAHVMRRNFTSFWQMLNPVFFWNSLFMHPFESMWSRTSRYFFTDRLRMVFTFATMYMGMSPFDAPSTYSLLQYTELAEGIWYPKGGFQTILEALVQIGESLGVQYRLSTPVKKILTNGDATTAIGVELGSGEKLLADVVVVNADLVYAYNHLFPQDNKAIARYAASLRTREASCSSISFYWSLSKKIDKLGTHNIFLASEYRGSFDDIFKRHSLPRNPSFYVNIPSRIDPSAAPEGCDAIIVLVPVGHLVESADCCANIGIVGGTTNKVKAELTKQDWPGLVAKAREAVLSTISERTGMERLDKYIVEETVNEPAIWESRFNLDRGAILGLSHSFMNVLALRPGTRARGLRSAYFVGASTHPGTGVPVVLSGARLTAEQILDDLGMCVPWRGKDLASRRDGASQKADTAALDRRRPPLWSSDGKLFILLLITVLVARILYDWLVAMPH